MASLSCLVRSGDIGDSLGALSFGIPTLTHGVGWGSEDVGDVWVRCRLESPRLRMGLEGGDSPATWVTKQSDDLGNSLGPLSFGELVGAEGYGWVDSGGTHGRDQARDGGGGEEGCGDAKQR